MIKIIKNGKETTPKYHDFPRLEIKPLPVYAKILQFAHEMYEHQTDVSITIIDDRFTIMGSMVEKEVIPEHILKAKVGEKNK